VDCSDATHSLWRCRSGTAARAAPAPPTAAQAASRAGRGASAATSILVSRSATPLLARAPRIPRPMVTPRTRADRGINDGPQASSAATTSLGAAGDIPTGLSTRANRRAFASHPASRSRAVARSMASVLLAPRTGTPSGHDDPVAVSPT
jgi:hypothetical protein